MMKSKISKNQILKKGFISCIAILLLLAQFSAPYVTLAANDDNAEIVNINDDLLPTEELENKHKIDIASLLEQLNEIKSAHFSYEEFAEKVSKNSVIYLSTEEELRALSIYVADGHNCYGKTFILTKNIALTSSMEWTPIGVYGANFYGTFDGAGHKITGLKITTEQNYAGFIGLLRYGEVRNLVIENPSDANLINIAPSLYNEITNFDFEEKYYLGAIVGYAYSSKISNCVNKANVKGIREVGGIAGNILNSSVDHCLNTGTISGVGDVGGIAGTILQKQDSKTETISSCYNTGSVFALQCGAGGIVGRQKGEKNIDSDEDIALGIKNCMNSGKISIPNGEVVINGYRDLPYNAGGIVGVMTVNDGNWDKALKTNLSSVKITGCINTANASVTGARNIGGIVGQLSTNSDNLQGGLGGIAYSYNFSQNITGTYTWGNNAYVGEIVGFLGYLAGNAYGRIYKCGYVSNEYASETRGEYSTGTFAKHLSEADSEGHVTLRGVGYSSALQQVNRSTPGQATFPDTDLGENAIKQLALSVWIDSNGNTFSLKSGNLDANYTVHRGDTVNCDFTRYGQISDPSQYMFKMDANGNYEKYKNSSVETAIAPKTIDEVAPALQSNGVSVVIKGKNTKFAKKGDTIEVTVPFDEEINLKDPRTWLTLNFSNNKTYTAENWRLSQDGKLLTYEYTLTGLESGTLTSIKVNGKVQDTFQNVNQLSAYMIALSDNNTIQVVQPGDSVDIVEEQDGITYTIENAHVGIDGNFYFNKLDTIVVKANLPEESDVNGVLKIKIGDQTYTKELSSKEGTLWTYSFASEGNGRIESIQLYNEETSAEIYPKHHLNDNAIFVDITEPTVEVVAKVDNVREEHTYPAGTEITIAVTSSEELDLSNSDRPEINVFFGNSGLGKYNYQGVNTTTGNTNWLKTEKNTETNKHTFYYQYVIQDGDDGNLEVYFANSAQKIADIAGNKTQLESNQLLLEEDMIQASTMAPFAKITGEKLEGENRSTILNNITNADVIHYTILWSKEVEEFTEEDITIINGELVDGSFEKTGANQYEVDILTSVVKGNIGNIQLIIEQNLCQDKAGRNNIRVENIIYVDKQDPILIGLEAIGRSNITVDEGVESVQQYYEAGQTVEIIATFNENITATSVPALALQFSESGNTKGTVSAGTIDGNKIIYTYTVTEKDAGILSVKGFSGKIRDAAGNEITVSKRTLEGDTIIADTVKPELLELKVTDPVTGTYKAGELIQIEAVYSEEIYYRESIGENQYIERLIRDNNAPVLNLQFGDGEIKAAEVIGYGKKEDGTEDKTRIIYGYEIVDGDNGKLTVVGYNNIESEDANTGVSDMAGNLVTLHVKQTGNVIVADTVRPSVIDISATVENPIILNTDPYYKEGNEIKIKVTFDENITPETLYPEIQVGFSEGNDEPADYSTCTCGLNWNENTVECIYVIKPGDNGYLWVRVQEGQFKDIAGNTNVAYEAVKKDSIYADTIAPTVTLTRDIDVEQNNQIITIIAEFSENVYDLNGNSRVTLTAANAPKLIYSFGTGENKEATATSVSGNKITYKITKLAEEDNGTLHYELAKGNLCDRAGNEYYTETTDTTAPELQRVIISPDPENEYGIYCKKDVNIYVTAIFDEPIKNQNMKLKIKLGDGAEKIISGTIVKVDNKNTNEIKYTYTVKQGDNGEFTIVDVVGNTKNDDSLTDKTYGYVQDAFGNQKNIFNLEGITVEGRAIADTTHPYIASITSDPAEITNAGNVIYTITWSEPVYGFDSYDIQVTNGDKVEFTGSEGDSVYTLTVSTREEGRQIIKVYPGVCEDIAGNLNEDNTIYNQVVVDYTKPVIRAKVNGGNYVLSENTRKAIMKDTIVVNEELSEFKYAWTTSEETPTTGWNSIDVSTIAVDSDVSLEKEVASTGNYYLHIKATDLAGNEITTRTRAFNVQTAHITITTNSTSVTNDKVVATVDFDERLTDNRKVTFKSEKTGEVRTLEATSDGKYNLYENGIIYAEATDKFGNKVLTQYTVYSIDKENPEIAIEVRDYTYSLGTTNETNKANLTASVTINESHLQTAKYIYSKNETLTTEEINAMQEVNTISFEATKQVNEIGTYYLHVYAKDIAGNESWNRSAALIVESAEESEITVYGNPENWTSSDVELYVTSVDELKALTVNGTNILNDMQYTVTTNGNYTFVATNAYGATTTKVITVNKIDKDVPVITKAETNDANNIITITATDDKSGIAAYAITTTTEVPVEWSKSNKINTTKNGAFYVWAKDNVGNIAMLEDPVTVNTNEETESNKAEITFEGVETIQKHGMQYVKVPATYTTEALTGKMKQEELHGKTPEYHGLTENNKLRTGTEIKLDGETKCIVIVKGDINCDGNVDFIHDVVAINNYRIGIYQLNELQVLAGDINNNGVIDFIPDIVSINNYRLGIANIL